MIASHVDGHGAVVLGRGRVADNLVGVCVALCLMRVRCLLLCVLLLGEVDEDLLQSGLADSVL